MKRQYKSILTLVYLTLISTWPKTVYHIFCKTGLWLGCETLHESVAVPEFVDPRKCTGGVIKFKEIEKYHILYS